MARSAMEQEELEKRLKLLRGSRTGKKSSITKRISQLQRYVEERQGRRATELLLERLHMAYGELEKVCNEISELCDEYDSKNNLEDIRFEIETCDATVTEYLEARKNDPPSTSSSIALSWVRKHAAQFSRGYEEVSSGHSSGQRSEDGKTSKLPGTTQPLKGPNIGRLTYSHSRPATPRALPKIPVSQISVFDNPVLALGAATSTSDDQRAAESQFDRSISHQLENLHIDDQPLEDRRGVSDFVHVGEEAKEHHDPNQRRCQSEPGEQGSIINAERSLGGLERKSVSLSHTTNTALNEVSMPLSLSFVGDGDVRKKGVPGVPGVGDREQDHWKLGIDDTSKTDMLANMQSRNVVSDGLAKGSLEVGTSNTRVSQVTSLSPTECSNFLGNTSVFSGGGLAMQLTNGLADGGTQGSQTAGEFKAGDFLTIPQYHSECSNHPDNTSIISGGRLGTSISIPSNFPRLNPRAQEFTVPGSTAENPLGFTE